MVLSSNGGCGTRIDSSLRECSVGSPRPSKKAIAREATAANTSSRVSNGVHRNPGQRACGRCRSHSCCAILRHFADAMIALLHESRTRCVLCGCGNRPRPRKQRNGRSRSQLTQKAVGKRARCVMAGCVDTALVACGHCWRVFLAIWYAFLLMCGTGETIVVSSPIHALLCWFALISRSACRRQN